MAGKKTTFSAEWTNGKLNPEIAPWIERVRTDPFAAHCSVCRVNFNLSNMGRTAVVSHMKGLKHIRNCGAKSSQGTLASYVTVTTPASACSSHTAAVTDSQSSMTDREKNIGSNVVQPSVRVSSSVDEPGTSTATPERVHALRDFVSNDQVTKAEILWALKCVMSHYSLNSCRDIKQIMNLMFPDSVIARKITLGSTKLSYVITHGLATYFHSDLTKTLNSCSEYVVCFDEALNKVAQRGQMDIVVRFWDNKTQLVTARYFTSAFMGHATAGDILEAFQASVVELPKGRLVQVSMDGPAVNWKFLESLDTHLRSDPSARVLLELGSCGLHIIHGSLQTGHKASGWDVNAYLRAMYSLFKDSPARRADYTRVTGSTKFPKKFCTVRWVENASVASRALEVLDNVKKYVSQAKNLPKTTTCTNVKAMCSDPLAMAKISFFASVAALLEPFLKRYQSAAPMVSFLYDDLSNILRSLVSRFVKRTVVDGAKTTQDLLKIDVSSKDIRCLYKDVDIGVAAQKAVIQCKVGDQEKMKFRVQCLDFLASTAAKMIERSPLRYSIVRAVSCFVPARVVSNRTLCERRMSELVQILYERNHLTSAAADCAKVQFANLCTAAIGDLKDTFNSFSRENSRLDAFYYSTVGQNNDYSDLWSVMKCVFVLSHGNATVESGFSVNGELLVENLLEESLVAQRQVYDAVLAAGGVAAVEINKSMLQFVRGSHSRYEDCLQRKRRSQDVETRKDADRKRAAEQIKQLKLKKAKIAESVATESKSIDRDIADLERLL